MTFSRSVLVLVLGFTLHGVALAAPSEQGLESRESHRPVCAKGNAGEVNCHSHVVTDAQGSPKAAPLPQGLSPAQLHGAYTIQTTANGSPIIAIVDAYDHPKILSDLNTYSKTFGIPQMNACNGPIATATNKPCFSKVNQSGGTVMPVSNPGWALEIALDVEAAHAMCQNCGILLVEANSASYSDLMTAVDQAVAQGATVVSNSYGSSEFAGETAYDYHFNRPGVAMTVSSGDAGYGAQYPAASRYVTAVGGTTLRMNGNTYVSESAWAGAGSGCSAFEAKQPWQTDSGCANRTIADVSAVADPATGAAVYNSVRYNGKSGWFTVGGTSLSAPIIAGMYALGGVPAAQPANARPYSFLSGLRDIVTGTNGTCAPAYLCTAVTGYDGPTGLGSPLGISSF